MAIKCKITETGDVRELSIIDPDTGMDWIEDLVGNTGAFRDGRFRQDREDDDLYHVNSAELNSEWIL